MPKRKRWNYIDIEKYRKWFEGQTATTEKRNARKLKAFCEWIRKTPELLLKEYEDANDKKAWQRDRKNEIEAFYNYLKERGYAINYCRTIPLGILSFYSRHAETIREGTKCFDAVQIPENEYIFTQEVLRKAFYYADLEGQTLLSVAVCLGYSSADFLELECEKLKNLVQEAKDKGLDFIQFVGKSRAKTSVQPRSHLTPEAIQCLSDYLPLLEKKHNGKLPKYLWCNGREGSHITNEGLNKKLKRIIRKASIETYGKQVKFHCVGRKFLYSKLQAKNRDIAKVITAKKVSASDITYIPDLNAECQRVFKETYKEIALNGDLTGKTKQRQAEHIEKLKQAIGQLESENSALKTRIDLLQNELSKTREQTESNYELIRNFQTVFNEHIKDLRTAKPLPKKKKHKDT